MEPFRARGLRSSLPGAWPLPLFENRTGRPDLDDLGAMAADWIIRGVKETPLVGLTELEAVYAGGRTIPGARGPADGGPR